MKGMKFLIGFILVIYLFVPDYSENRREPLPMEQLTNPDSKYYVPHPYPKTRKEIIANLRFQFKRKYDLKKMKPIKRITLLDIVEGKTSYMIGRIIKVKNRIAHMPHEYNWLILILDKNYKIHSRLSMQASGRFTGSTNCMSSPGGGSQGILKTKREILHILSNAIERPIRKDDLKQMERVAFAFSFCTAPECAPMWEIVLSDGSLYYYSVLKDIVYTIEKRIPYKKDKNGFWEDPKPKVPNDCDYVIDTINEEILLLKVL